MANTKVYLVSNHGNWYHLNYSNEWFVLSQIRGRVVVFRDLIHMELRHT